MSLMLMNAATRKAGRAARLPEAGIPSGDGPGLSRSAVSRCFKALTEERMAEWMASDLSHLELPVIRIDGMRINDKLLMIGALGIDGNGAEHPLGVAEGATENAATVQALLDNPIERGLEPDAARLFIVDGSKASGKAVRQIFGADAAIQRCQARKARNIMDRLDARFHPSVRHTLRQAWRMNDAEKAKRLPLNLARRLETEAPGSPASIREGMDGILTVIRLDIPLELRRSLASANGIESMQAVVRNVCLNVKRWRNAQMALRWTAAGMMEAGQGFRRLKACKQLPVLKAALERDRREKAGKRVDRPARVA